MIVRRTNLQSEYSYRNCKGSKWRKLGIVLINPLFEDSNIILREFGLFDFLRTIHQIENRNKLACMGRSSNSSTKIEQTALDLRMTIYLWI